MSDHEGSVVSVTARLPRDELFKTLKGKLDRLGVSIDFEPIYQNDKIVGYVTSGMYSHFVDQSVALGYVPADLANHTGSGAFDIEILGDMRP